MMDVRFIQSSAYKYLLDNGKDSEGFSFMDLQTMEDKTYKIIGWNVRGLDEPTMEFLSTNIVEGDVDGLQKKNDMKKIRDEVDRSDYYDLLEAIAARTGVTDFKQFVADVYSE